MDIDKFVKSLVKEMEPKYHADNNKHIIEMNALCIGNKYAFEFLGKIICDSVGAKRIGNIRIEFECEEESTNKNSAIHEHSLSIPAQTE